MQYQPMAAKAYSNGRQIRAGHSDLQRKFFDQPLLEIAEQTARDHRTALSLRNRVQQQLEEITSLVEQSRAYQAQIDDLRNGILVRTADVERLDTQLKKIEEIVKTSGTVLNFKVALEAVSVVYGIAPQLIKGPSRDRIAIAARKHLVHILTTHRSDLSYQLIGRLLGNRDHTTIIHARDAWALVAHKYERQVVAVNRLLGIPLAVDNAHKSETDRPHADDLGTDCSRE